MKTLIAAIALVAAAGAAPLRAQGPPPESYPPEVVLKEVLGLSDAQVAQLQGMETERAGQTQQIAGQIQEKQIALAGVLSVDSPDPAAAGALVVQIHALEKQLAAVQQAFGNAFGSMLDADQRQRLEFVRSVGRALAGVEALGRLGL